MREVTRNGATNRGYSSDDQGVHYKEPAGAPVPFRIWVWSIYVLCIRTG